METEGERTAQLEAINGILRREYEHLALAADAAGLGFWNFDSATSSFTWDEKTFQLYGSSRSAGSLPYGEWLGKLHPNDRDRCEREIAETLERKSRLESEFRVVLPDGRVRHLLAAARVSEEDDAVALNMYGVTFDITEKKRADERFHLAIEAAPTGMLLMTLTGITVFVNAQIEALFGHPRAELLGRHIDMLLPERLRSNGDRSGKSIFDDPHTGSLGVEEELNGLHKHGHEIPIEVVLNPVHTSDGEFFLSSWTDISERKHSEAISQQMTALVESADDAIITKNLDGVILSWNGAAQRLLGYSADEIIGQSINALLPEDRQNEEMGLFKEIKDGTRVSNFETVRRRQDGSLVDVALTISPIRNRAGTIIRASAIMRDITERKRATEHFRLALEAAPTAMLMMDQYGAITLVNAQVESLFGYSREELLGQKIEMLVPKRFRANHPQLREGFFTTPRMRAMGAGVDLYGLRKDGSEMPVEIDLNPLQTAQGLFVISSIVDLSRQREVERMRSDFVSTVSHELRTPLTSISGSLALLQSGAVGKLPDTATAMVRIAHKNSERLVRIINDILDIGKLEAGKLVFHRHAVPLSDLIRQSIEVNSTYADKYGVRYLLDDGTRDELTFIDSDRLMQVLANLLSNAAKFSPPGRDVHIRSRCSSSATLRVEVEDEGAGIPEAFQSRIFEKFSQADASATRRFEGTGLGLCIARQMIEGMGGKIGFSSEVGKGTIFHLELPRLGSAGRTWRAR